MRFDLIRVVGRETLIPVRQSERASTLESRVSLESKLFEYGVKKSEVSSRTFKRKKRPMTQEELLMEADRTEIQNASSLKQFKEVELEIKRSRALKRKKIALSGPVLRYRSFCVDKMIELKPTGVTNTVLRGSESSAQTNIGLNADNTNLTGSADLMKTQYDKSNTLSGTWDTSVDDYEISLEKAEKSPDSPAPYKSPATPMDPYILSGTSQSNTPISTSENIPAGFSPKASSSRCKELTQSENDSEVAPLKQFEENQQPVPFQRTHLSLIGFERDPFLVWNAEGI